MKQTRILTLPCSSTGCAEETVICREWIVELDFPAGSHSFAQRKTTQKVETIGARGSQDSGK